MRVLMELVPSSERSIGLDLTPSSLRIAECMQSKGKLLLNNIAEISLPKESSEEDSQTLYVNEHQTIEQYCGSSITISSLSAAEVLVRPLEINLTKDKDIDAVFAFQAETLLPYSAEEAAIDHIKIGKDQDKSIITVVATRKSRLEEHLDRFKQFGIEPESISATPVALAAFSENYLQTLEPHFILHLGVERASCALIQRGKVISALQLPVGVIDLIDALCQDRRCTEQEAESLIHTVDFSQITSESSPHLAHILEKFKKEVEKTVFALEKQNRSELAPEILITGNGALLAGLPELLAESAEKTLLAPIVEENSKYQTHEILKYAVVIGLAFSNYRPTNETINFRRDEFTYLNPWKRTQKPLLLYSGLCLSLAFLFFIFGNVVMSSREDVLKKDYSNLLSLAGKTHPAFEKERAKKIGLNFKGGSQLVSIRDFTSSQLQKRLNFLKSSIQSTPITYPLQPNIPRVSDVLAWASTHPNIVVGDKTLITIETFNYKMVKHPTERKKNDKYQVQVELEFTSLTPKHAREFHDALVADTTFVDSGNEIKWSVNRGKYRASFFLKDLTVYPSNL